MQEKGAMLFSPLHSCIKAWKIVLCGNVRFRNEDNFLKLAMADKLTADWSNILYQCFVFCVYHSLVSVKQFLQIIRHLSTNIFYLHSLTDGGMFICCFVSFGSKVTLLDNWNMVNKVAASSNKRLFSTHANWQTFSSRIDERWDSCRVSVQLHTALCMRSSRDEIDWSPLTVFTLRDCTAIVAIASCEVEQCVFETPRSWSWRRDAIGRSDRIALCDSTLNVAFSSQ